MATTNIGEPLPREKQRTSRKSDTVRSEIEQLLKSWAERTGFPLDELNRLRAKREVACSRMPISQAPVSAFVPDEEEIAFRQTLEKEGEFLRSLSPLTTIIKLDHPDTIELSGNVLAVKLFQPIIGPFSSQARLVVAVGDSPSNSSTAGVTTTYRWNNSSPNFALINVGTLLRIRGSYDITANGGFFDGNTNKLDVSARLRMEINGAEIFTAGNLFQTVVNDEASAGSLIFGSGDAHVMEPVIQAVGLGADMIVIPPGADVSFIIDLTVDCRLDADASIGDDISVDFGTFTDPVLNVIQYPFLNVEVLAN